MAKQKTSAPKAAAAIMAEKKASAPKAAAAIMTKKKATASQAAAATPVNKASVLHNPRSHDQKAENVLAVDPTSKSSTQNSST